MIVWGMVQYRDALETHMTRFCMSVIRPMGEPAEFKPITCDYGFSGPAAYNRFT